MSDKQPHSGVYIYKRLLTYVGQYKGVFAAAIGGMVITALADAGFVSMLKPIMDDGLVAKNPTLVKWLPILLILYIFAAWYRCVFGYLWNDLGCTKNYL